MENIVKQGGITWYRFGQKKGSLLGREIPFVELFVKYASNKIKYFPFIINNYKYINWTHFIDKNDVDLIVSEFAKKLLGLKNLSVLLNQSKATRQAGETTLKRMRLLNPNKTQLLKYFERFIYFSAKIEGYLPCSNFVVRTLSWEVEKYLKILFPLQSEEKIKQIAMDVAYNENDSVFLKRHIDLLKLASRKKLETKDYEKFIKKYQWMGMMFLIYRPLSITDLKLEISDIKQPLVELKGLANLKRSAIKKRNILLQRIDDRKFLALIKLLRESSLVETEILKNFQQLQYEYLPLLQSIAKTLNTDYNHLIYCEVKEIKNALLNKGKLPPKNILEKRDKEGYSFIILDGKCHFDYLNKAGGRQVESTLKGVCACKGKVVGRARIIFDVNEMDKVKTGDILITGMTTPNFVPAMKRAAAIVTNDGGITCHAAIVSRELGKPCIIGTKRATSVLKDGDLIKVDANHGVITILKK